MKFVGGFGDGRDFGGGTLILSSNLSISLIPSLPFYSTGTRAIDKCCNKDR